MKLFRTVALVGALMVSGGAQAAEWYLVGATRGFGEVKYVDLSSLKRVSEYHRGWFFAIDADSEYRELIEYDCSEERWRILASQMTKVDGTTKGLNAPTSWRYVIPDSISASSMAIVCSLGERRDRSIQPLTNIDVQGVRDAVAAIKR